ncbi:hypothetical protein [Gilvibacter sp. SZ-19]|uniref:hypothetical protein n=1 Tax=unclassified Gilvibacter TaxID=2625242 RepID=UPI000B3D1927|nr:hypothetical protein [Gilvibacter sp. SZ-19]ARV11526.1 hypothetical protein BTO09_03860 [Gilvibacter sp. SZ-19]
MKKFFVLGFLFILPLVTYMFFAAANHNFRQLPTLGEPLEEMPIGTLSVRGDSISLFSNITILGFLGKDAKSRYGHVFNLAHKIYTPYSEFYDLQFVWLIPEGAEGTISELEEKLSKIKETSKWQFVVLSDQQIRKLKGELGSPYPLEDDLGTDYVYIIDKDRRLRGRNQDEEIGMMYGYDASNVSELHKKMKDDVKVLLEEYRRALKKNNKYKRKQL